MNMYIKKIGLLLAICGLISCGGETVTKPEAKRPSAPTTAAKPSTSTAKPTTSQPSAKPSSGSGGYYLDDGPGDNPPADIDNIPDATLKTEAPFARSNKPYSALGQQYVPMTNYAPYKKQGIASWYGKRYHGRKTSSGEVYDMYGMSAAHPILPIPSYVKVTNPANGRSVVVRVNDRGPFKHDRLIDLSYAAAYKLRLISQGSGLVEVEALDTSPEAIAKINSNPPTSTSRPVSMEAVAVTSPIIEILPTASSTSASTQYYVQAGAFKAELNGELLQKKIVGLQLAENVGVSNVYNNGLYRVRLGPYASKKEADTSAANIRKQLNISAIVLTQ